jgi:hypothetical protein
MKRADFVLRNGLCFLRPQGVPRPTCLAIARTATSSARAFTSLSHQKRPIFLLASMQGRQWTCLTRPPHSSVCAFLARRGYQDYADNRPPRPPELDLKSQSSDAMNELQKEQEIKEQAKKSGKPPVAEKADILDEKTLSKAEQRKVNWGILKTLVKYIWPKARPPLPEIVWRSFFLRRGRIILGFGSGL